MIAPRPVVALLALAAALPAGEAAAVTRFNQPATTSEFAPGRPVPGAGRQVVVQGMLNLDSVQRTNDRDANSETSDHRGYGILHAELGFKLHLDERATVAVGVGYRSDIGDYGPSNQRPGNPTPRPNEAPVASDRAQLVLAHAYVHLKEMFGLEELGALAGRMPVRWNLVQNRGAFLYDARADDPVIGAWDGARISYSGIDEWVFSPWIYRLPDASVLGGLTIDWQPMTAGSDRLFLTGLITEHRDAVVPRAQGAAFTAARLRTYGFGLDWRIGETDLWFDGAAQRGDALGGQRIAGYGAEAGVDWQFTPYGKGRLAAIAGFQRGDDPATRDIESFVAPWESISDTLIVEHEQYGELTRLLVGNLLSAKLRFGIGFDERDRWRIELTAAHYRLHQPLAADGGREFASELDAVLRWQYTYNVQLRLFGGVAEPGAGLRDAIRLSGLVPGDDLIWIFGGNLNVSF
ncbi:MAG: alginate export family protein [Planctomycetota bacterium]|nr:alginate export family protein [Planctomycetota bacterium]